MRRSSNQAAPYPRLARLLPYEALDPAAQAELDTLTCTLANALEAPVALLAFSDDNRQWLKSRYGIGMLETVRALTFCTQVADANAALYVEDARSDPRYASNPYVTGAPHVRFFAAAPVTAPDGFVLGTLCVIDHEPRVVTPAHRAVLEGLAKHATLVLETCRKAALLQEQKNVLGLYARFFELSFDPLCTTDDHWKPRRLNSAWTRTLGWPLETLLADSLLTLVHDADRELALQESAKLLNAEPHAGSFELRLRHRAGHWVPLAWTMRAVNNTLFGSVRDLSETKAKEAALGGREARLRAVLDAMVEGAVVYAASGEVVASNAAARTLIELGPELMAGRAPPDAAGCLVRPDGSRLAPEEYPALVALRTGRSVDDAVLGVHKPSGELTWLAVNARLVRASAEHPPDGVVTTFRDMAAPNALASRGPGGRADG